MNPFLFLLAMLAGFALTWVLVVRTVKRDVPVGQQAGPPAPVRPAPGPAPFTPADFAPASIAPAAAATGATVAVGGRPGDQFSDQRQAGDADAPAPTARGAIMDWADEETVATELDPETGPEALAGLGAATAAARLELPPWTEPGEGGQDPEGYTVKGDRKAQLYLVGTDPDFGRARADIWFVDEDAAKNAGFSHYDRTK